MKKTKNDKLSPNIKTENKIKKRKSVALKLDPVKGVASVVSSTNSNTSNNSQNNQTPGKNSKHKRNNSLKENKDSPKIKIGNSPTKSPFKPTNSPSKMKKPSPAKLPLKSKKEEIKNETSTKETKNLKNKKESNELNGQQSSNNAVIHPNIPSINNNLSLNVKEDMFIKAIEIINEIQTQFEKCFQESRSEDDIKKIIGSKTDLDSYIPLTEEQKDHMTKDIKKSSELRMENYKTVFSYIESSLNDIKIYYETNKNNESEGSEDDKSTKGNKKNIRDTLLIIKQKSQEKGEKEKKEKIKSIPLPPKNKNGNDNNTNTNIKSNGSTSLKNEYSNEDTDFSESAMLENAFVVPPKNSPFNYQNVKDMTRYRSKKFSIYPSKRKSTKKTLNKENKKINIDQILPEENYVNTDSEEEKEEKNKEEESDENEIIEEENSFVEVEEPKEKELKIERISSDKIENGAYVKDTPINGGNIEINKDIHLKTISEEDSNNPQGECFIY
ncbi:MAG: hypothetical protein MJ252_01885 [archaeon]|nr:hypothetical protein [archaeon]